MSSKILLSIMGTEASKRWPPKMDSDTIRHSHDGDVEY